MRQFLLIVALGLFLHAGSINIPQNFQANFTQKITNPKKKVINYSGKVYFSDGVQNSSGLIQQTDKKRGLYQW